MGMKERHSFMNSLVLDLKKMLLESTDSMLNLYTSCTSNTEHLFIYQFVVYLTIQSAYSTEWLGKNE